MVFKFKSDRTALVNPVLNADLIVTDETHVFSPDTSGDWSINYKLPEHWLTKMSPEWFTKIRKSVLVHFIETQRLLYIDTRKQVGRTTFGSVRPAMMPVVKVYSEEIAATIKAKLAESSDLSQSLDKTFPARVFNPKPEQSKITFDELRKRLAAINETRAKLSSVGLLDDDNSNGSAFQIEDEIDESKKIMLAVYVEDTEKKLGIFDDLEAKIGLLTRIINKRFLYKQMTLDKDEGFIFTTTKSIDLPLENLSSGEQHELVLFYQLLFKVTPGSLVLIDEPELSLHVVWQEYFLRDLQEVTKLVNIDALIATHSPDIIHDRRDLIVELVGPE